MIAPSSVISATSADRRVPNFGLIQNPRFYPSLSGSSHAFE